MELNIRRAGQVNVHFKMFTMKEVLVVFGVFALTGSAERVIRSPDRMEINIPTYSYERESGEYQENMNQEATYWQCQGDKLGDKEEEGHQQLEDHRDKNQENYEHEKDHTKEQQHNVNKEVNETYQDDRNKVEAHYETNQEHYMRHNNTNYEVPQANKTAEDLKETEIGDRYEEEGTEYVVNGQEKIENYEVNKDDLPSISYSKS